MDGLDPASERNERGTTSADEVIRDRSEKKDELQKRAGTRGRGEPI